jgi:hypothetical protein
MSLLSTIVLAAAATAPAAAADRPATAAGEPAVERRVVEDRQVRIEELKVRGETTRVVVQPKAPGAKAYEITPVNGATDPSQGRRSSAGERLWRFFSF